MGIVLLETVLAGILGFAFEFALSFLLGPERVEEVAAQVGLTIGTIGFMTFIAAALYLAFIPGISFRKGMLIYWARNCIAAVIVAPFLILFLLLWVMTAA